jgi:hypothetical protein
LLKKSWQLLTGVSDYQADLKKKSVNLAQVSYKYKKLPFMYSNNCQFWFVSFSFEVFVKGFIILYLNNVQIGVQILVCGKLCVLLRFNESQAGGDHFLL